MRPEQDPPSLCAKRGLCEPSRPRKRRGRNVGRPPARPEVHSAERTEQARHPLTPPLLCRLPLRRPRDVQPARPLGVSDSALLVRDWAIHRLAVRDLIALNLYA
jgi:hypothetical protein